MKKIIILTISILMVTAVFARRVKADNPIPSYNVPVTNTASFQESVTGPSNYVPTDEKRDMNVSNDAGGGNRPINGASNIVVYVYRLDRSVVRGPFTVAPGQTITVLIDGNRWGVYAEAGSPTFMSVWASTAL
jgi:hypothetical protein